MLIHLFNTHLLSSYCVPGTKLWRRGIDTSLFSLSLLSGWGPLTMDAMKPGAESRVSMHFSGKGLQDLGWALQSL